MYCQQRQRRQGGQDKYHTPPTPPYGKSRKARLHTPPSPYFHPYTLN
ncbi:hypothetical protein [Fischerella thermalis]|nr:hypothetical protein [Fischerella thermalis]MBF1988109.1 hypothetical protein [Fischerella thermalis M58_A2018_009]